jgi:hypothetical protein
MNQMLQDFAREWLKQSLAELPESNHMLFKRMYSHMDLEKPINAVVDAMAPEKLDWAMQQVENSLKKGDVT